jgi:hypothetical protein
MDSSENPKVRFTWIMHYVCNYRCPYCFYYEGSGWEILKERNLYLPLGEWIKHWQRIYDKYGRCYILLTGGEPFVYPHFLELISELSKIHFPINISTNSSGDFHSFVQTVPSDRVSLSLSFHPHFDELGVFLKRVEFLRKNNFSVMVGITAYPPLLKNFKYYMEMLMPTGAEIRVNFFRGVYKGIAYPAGYAEGEKALIGLTQESLDKTKKKGSICYAGKQSGVLLPDGKVSRCGQLWYNCIIGDFFDPDFSLLDEPGPCPVETCPCSENALWGENDAAT